MATRKDLASSLRLPYFACALQLFRSLILLVKLVTCYWIKDLIHESDLTICLSLWFQLTFYVKDSKISFFLLNPLTWTPNHITKCLFNISTRGPTENLNSTYQNMNLTSISSPPFPLLPSHSHSVSGRGTSITPHAQTIAWHRASKGPGAEDATAQILKLKAPTSCQTCLSLSPD